MKFRLIPLIWLTLAATLVTSSALAGMGKVTTAELKTRLGEQGLTVVDVRTSGDWSKSDRMIAGAMRGNPYDMETWSTQLAKDQTIILYCA